MKNSASKDPERARTDSGRSSAGAKRSLDGSSSEQLPAGGEIDARLLPWFKLSAIAAAIVVFVAGALAAAGWAFGIDALKHPTEEPAVQSAAAINFLLLSTSMLLLCVGSPRLWRTLTGRCLATIVVVASVATFIEHTGHLSIGDLVHLTLWPPAEDHGLGLTYPGPLLPHESFSFGLLGLGTVLINVVLKKKIYPWQLLAVTVFVPSFIILSCYMLGQSHVCIYFGCVQLSPICSLVLLLYSLGLFFAASDKGAARIFSLKSTTGKLARRACGGVAILILALLPRQWLITAGEAAGVVDASTVNSGTAIVALLALCAFGWWCFHRIEAEETEKHQAIEEITQAIEMMQREAESNEPTLFKLVCLTCAAEYHDLSLSECPEDQSPLISLKDDFRPGTTFDQRYEILLELGAGGMSTVYLAQHLLMNKKVAVKVLQARFASNLTAIQRFQREAQAASSLSHPNLAPVYDFNVTKNGQAYMVMEFLEGQSLSEFIEKEELMPWREAALLLLEICDGMHHAHSNNVIHRDLKPGNIMLLPSPLADQRYTPKIVDFGLAKIFDDAGLHLTQTGDVFGSPYYMSPEQCKARPLDERSDIYSIGCIMYEVLAGHPPFEGEGVLEVMTMHVEADLPVLPPTLGIPAWVEAICHKAMAKNPENRFQSIEELSESLAQGLVQQV